MESIFRLYPGAHRETAGETIPIHIFDLVQNKIKGGKRGSNSESSHQGGGNVNDADGGAASSRSTHGKENPQHQGRTGDVNTSTGEQFKSGEVFDFQKKITPWEE